jgi:hypothetical protein
VGHEIIVEGVDTESRKNQPIKEWVVPTNAKEVRRFLGLVGYYRRFVKNFGITRRSLFDLLKKGVVFMWTRQTEDAFQALKQALI